MNPLGRRAARDFARALDEPSAPAPPRLPDVGLARRLQAAAPALDAATEVRPEFRAALRGRLVAAAAPGRPVRPDPVAATAPRAPRRLAFVAGAVAAVVALGGVGLAGSRSLPGEPLYGVKHAAEALELGLARGELARGRRHLEFAQTRLREAWALTDAAAALAPFHGSADPVAAQRGPAAGRVGLALAAMDRETRAGQRLLERAWAHSHATAPLQVLTAFSASQGALLRPLVALLPSAGQASARSSLALLDGLTASVARLHAAGRGPAATGPPVIRPPSH